MGDKKKQKFSLSDIIRKLNETAADAPKAKPDSSGRTETAFEAVSPLSEASLPLQVPPGPDETASNRRLKENARLTPASMGFASHSLDTTMSDETLPVSSFAGKHSDASDLTPPPKMPAEDTESEEFDIMRYVGILLRRKNIIIAALIVGSFFSMNSYIRAIRFYTAHARMLFSPGYQDIIGNNQSMYFSWGSREEKLNTHLELIKSHTVLNRVAENLGKNIAVGAIAGGLRVTRGATEGEKNDIVDISYSNANAEMASDVVNEICKSYMEYIKEVNVQDITRLIVKLEDQIKKIEKDLDVKENTLRVFKENNRTVELSSETNVIIAKLSQVETARQQTQLDMLESREKFIGLKKEIDQQEVDVIQSMTYQNPYQNRLAELELQLNTLSAEYSPEHFKVRMIKAEIDKIKDAMKSDIIKEASSKTFIKNPIRESLLKDLINTTIEKSGLEAKRSAQEQLARQLDTDLQKLPTVELQYAQLTRETESQLQVIKLLKNRFEEAKIKRDSQDSDLKILEWAQIPTLSVSNVKFSKMLITLLIGLIIGIALAFLLEYLDQSIKEPQDIERTLELPLLGIVPTIETEKAIIESARDRGKTILEPFRALRANLKHIAQQRNAKTFIVASAVKGEGKTTLAANMAITFAMDGKKVILVDGDLRRAQMHGLFHLPKKTGLCDYLLGAAEVRDILKPTVHQSLFVITAGEHPQNPAELVGSFRFSELVNELRAMADIIIFDSPALLPVSDVLSMAPKMDACIIVVRALWTPLKAAQQAKIQLQRIGCSIVGAILNGISHSRGYYPYYYGYYRYYAYKYSYEEDQGSKVSLRRFGLAIESKFKGFVQTIRLSLPRRLIDLRRFSRQLFRRRIFWVLLSAAIVLSVTETVMKRSGILFLPKRSVTFLGAIAPNKKTIADSTLSQQPALNHATPLEAVSSSAHNGNDSAAASSSGNSAWPDHRVSPSAAMDTIKPSICLQDSLMKWLMAFNQKDLQRYFSFYYSVLFQFPGGNFQAWKTESAENILHRRGNRLSIDSIWFDSMAAPYYKMTLNASLFSPGDTTKVQYGMLWQNVRNTWRIIREKQRRFR